MSKLKNVKELSSITLIAVLHNESEGLEVWWQRLLELDGLRYLGGILLIDNGSTDDSARKLLDIQKRGAPCPLDLCFRVKNHMGYARNQALELTKTPFVLFLDGDCEPGRDWLLQYAEVLAGGAFKNLSLAGVGGPAQPDPLSEGGLTMKLLTRFWWTHLGSPQARLPRSGEDESSVSGEGDHVDHLPCSNAMLLRDVVLKEGGFHPFLARVGEDLELGWRLGAGGYRWLFDSRLALNHRRNLGLVPWSKKMWNYGRAQVTSQFLLGSLRRKVFLGWIAFLGLMLFLTLLFFSPLWALGLFLGYASLVAAQVVWPFGRKSDLGRGETELLRDIAPRLRALSLIPLTHFFYASGMVFESLRVLLFRSSLKGLASLAYRR